tara:strand:+ start:815 stop:1255 length:441 start_codon:yes stop_codon:yes gene_type:complete
MKNSFKIIFSCLILSSTAACSPITAQRGNLLEDYQITEVKAGESTQSDVLRILGSPTTQSTFNNSVWYYLGQETEKHGILDAEVVNERIIAVTFNDQGIVDTIENLNNDRENIPYARGKTPTHGNDLTFMQQLLGNMGRFNAPRSN